MTVTQLAQGPRRLIDRVRPGRASAAADVKERAGINTTVALIVGSSGVLLIGGLIMILSSSWVSAYQNYGSSFLFFLRQLVWAGVGLLAMLIASRIDYRRFRVLGYLLLAMSIVGLIAVLHPAIGVRVSGSSRWIAFGPARIQPSELAKLALVLVGADLCTRKLRRLTTIKEVMLPFGAIAGLVGVLVMLQPDLGTTLILGATTFGVIYVAGTSMRVVGVMGAAGGVAALGLAFSEGYRRARLMSFRDPFSDPLNTGYQAVQAQIALGSGGLFGVGLGASRQKWLYVPNAHTDFIFAIIGEEVGLLGTLAVIALFAILGFAGVRTARRAPDVFGRIVAGGITAWIAGQALINMGAVTGLLPITGVPLPLVSFGGSSLVFTMVALGILVNIARQEQWPPKPVERPSTPPLRGPERTAAPARRTSRPRA